MFNLDQNDAQVLLGFISSIIIPFAVSWIKQASWPDWAKFALAVVLSLVSGLLTVIATGQFKADASLIQNGAVIFLAVQAIYFTVFRGLGLERVIYPKSAVIQAAQDEVKDQLSTMSSQMAKDVLNPDKPPAVDVDAKLVNLKADIV